MLGFEDEFHFP